MDNVKEERSLATLVSDLTRETSELMRKEIELAKAEMADKAHEVKTGLVALVVGGAIMIAGLIYVLNALVYGIAEVLPEDLSPWLAALLVGIAGLAIGYAMIKKGQSNLEPSNLTPTRTAASLHKDKEMVKEQI